MAANNELSIIIDGIKVKEIRCKNDDCRALLGYENIKIGYLFYTCPNCGELSTFKIGYRQAYDKFIADLGKKYQLKGGE